MYEQNRNITLWIKKDGPQALGKNYLWKKSDMFVRQSDNKQATTANRHF